MPITQNIQIDTSGNCPATAVSIGDKVQWTAPSSSAAWVKPPSIFSSNACDGKIQIPAGTTLPSNLNACPVSANASPGSHIYSSGLGSGPITANGGNDTITIIAPEPQKAPQY